MKKILVTKIFASVFFVLLILFLLTGCVQKKPQGTLLAELQNANAIAWISPHNDDEMLAGGLLALASLDYNKNVYVIAQDANAIAIFPATTIEERLQDNNESKKYLGLKDYIYANSLWNIQYLKNFVEQKGIDIIFSFENTNGFGNPEHAQASQALTKFAKENNIKLYYLINRDPAINYMYGGKPAELDPLPITDTLNLDEFFVNKNGKAISLWTAKFELVKIYSSSQPNAYSIIVTNPERINELKHEENYRKIN